MSKIGLIWFRFIYAVTGVIWWLFVRPFTKIKKPEIEKQLSEWEGNLKLVKFKELIWWDIGGLSTPYPTYNPAYSGIKEWLEKNVAEYKLIDGSVMSEDYIEGVYLLPEDILIFKLVWGEYI